MTEGLQLVHNNIAGVQWAGVRTAPEAGGQHAPVGIAKSSIRMKKVYIPVRNGQ